MLPSVVIIDNFDSFTYNLFQIVKESGLCSYRVIQRSNISFEDIQTYDGILISPGPGVPSDAPMLKKTIQHFEKDKSILGICLGHQAIIEAYGGHLINMETVYHGMSERIKVSDSSDYLFRGLPSSFHAGLYHSWKADHSELPEDLEITATSERGVIMAVKHKVYDIRGLQFHPESYITTNGRIIIRNWLENLN